MTSPRATPGPWRENSFCGEMDGVGLRDVYVETPTGPVSVCRVSATNQDANARLIASAPDLLAFVERVREAVSAGTGVLPTALRPDAGLAFDVLRDLERAARALLSTLSRPVGEKGGGK